MDEKRKSVLPRCRYTTPGQDRRRLVLFWPPYTGAGRTRELAAIHAKRNALRDAGVAESKPDERAEGDAVPPPAE
jgi:hypothetical protein